MKFILKLHNWLWWTWYCKQCDARINRLGYCSACYEKLPINITCCIKCAKPMSIAAICTDCLSKPPHIITIAPYLYKEPLDELVKNLKYNNKLINAKILAELLLPHICERDVDYIIPVPLHTNRLRSRGFNQAVEIGKSLSKKIGVPLQKNWAIRVLETQPQFNLSQKLRKKQMKNAFRATDAISNLPKGSKIAILDDIITSGATVYSLASTLKKINKYLYIECWVALRSY